MRRVSLAEIEEEATSQLGTLPKTVDNLEAVKQSCSERVRRAWDLWDDTHALKLAEAFMGAAEAPLMSRANQIMDDDGTIKSSREKFSLNRGDGVKW